MTINDLDAILVTTGFPVAYHSFDGVMEPPCIVYLTPFSNNTYADNKVYKKGNRWQIELYTDKKDPASEAILETALDVFCWERTGEARIESEGLYQVIYEFEEVS
jgi:hypothetical protein